MKKLFIVFVFGILLNYVNAQEGTVFEDRIVYTNYR